LHYWLNLLLNRNGRLAAFKTAQAVEGLGVLQLTARVFADIFSGQPLKISRRGGFFSFFILGFWGRTRAILTSWFGPRPLNGYWILLTKQTWLIILKKARMVTVDLAIVLPFARASHFHILMCLLNPRLEQYRYVIKTYTAII